MVPNWLFLKELVGAGQLSQGGVGRTTRATFGTDLGLGFDALTGCPRLSCTCHAQWKESKPDLTGGQWQYVMGFLGVERAAAGGKLILYAGNQPK